MTKEDELRIDKPDEHFYTDKEIIALAEKELEKVRAENERLSAEIEHLHSVIATMCKTIKTEQPPSSKNLRNYEQRDERTCSTFWGIICQHFRSK